MFETTRRDGVCRISCPETRWLSTGYDGGESRGPVAYNVTVPKGWPETDLDSYVAQRLSDAGFDEDGPALLTGVDQQHARRARYGPVEVIATAGVSNPAALPMDVGAGGVAGEGNSAGDEGSAGKGDSADYEGSAGSDTNASDTEADHVGTVNVVVGTSRSLEPGALANLVAVAAEAKAATLLARCGSPGTTTDAIVAACDPAGEPETFTGSATPVGHAARICVRDAVLASLDSRYANESIPQSVESARFGVVAADRATVTPIRRVDNFG
ncbi:MULTISPECIES: adenosylcobinamide amidohydrolase [Haloferax]|uniref:Adenosylcobinamide amidohydrolase n=1 Tax=Haloferax marinum TaxID=2666143 RepID=A0A6A8G7W7_9EURY|nr:MULTISPECIES: adenosylcobinamide amidohydrolase [Haloferax]KAB1197180.1 adenosylcobinamide amidohydrolase [Haloferax sp. CBA1150]MRW96216.1 adenosylcobinamide amidohydrolase [Haloferax marinum]